MINYQEIHSVFLEILLKVVYFISGFKPDEVMNQLNESLASLKLNFAHIFYLHWPDRNIPIEETLKGIDQLYKGGLYLSLKITS